MADLAQAFSEIKSLPDHILQKEITSPSGSIPGWLALGEIHERKRMRATHGAGANKRPSMAEEYAGSIQPHMAGAGMQPPPQQPPVPPNMPGGGIAGLPPAPQAGLASMPQARAPQGYAEGGIVRLAQGGILSYANQKAIRNQQIQEALQAQLQEAIQNVYGPGYTGQIYSGGQEAEGSQRTGSHRHDEGRAADIHILDPQGNVISGNALAPLGQYWAAKKYGGVGMEMHGGGIHLDDWTTPPAGGGMAWNYADQGGQYTAGQKAAIEAGLSGQMPTLYGGVQVASASPQMGIEQYIRARAPVYGIDPDIAVRVAQSEGGMSNILRQSDVMKGGQREESYGPFQLYMQGGLGNRALAAGIDPRTQEGAWKGIDFALAEAGTKGWGQWYGAKRVGIDAMQGISGQGSRTPVFDETQMALLNNPTAAAAEGTAQASNAVATTAADTATKMAGATTGTDPMSQYFMMQQLLGGQQQQTPAPVGGGATTPGRPVDPSQFMQNPYFMQRRKSYGFA